jgi:multidrug resistance efflux pump
MSDHQEHEKGPIHEGHAQAAPQGRHGPHGGIGENPVISRIKRHPLMAEIAFLVVVIAVAGAYLFIQDMEGKIFVEKAEISAPVISIGSPVSGRIEKIYVGEGDSVSEGQRLALIGNTTIYSQARGIIIWTKDNPGQMTGPSDTIIKMVQPGDFRVVGRVQEDKGLRDIEPGQRVVFTVDAFGDTKYEGYVDSVAMTARSSDIVFSISDKREPREFEVRVLYDAAAHPELKNGMSAKIWIAK